MLKEEPMICDSLDELIDSIKQSDTYEKFRKASEEVNKQPGLREQIDEFRKKNFLIQQNYEGDELLWELEKFERENSAFRAQPLVDQFLSSEVAFIRLKQEIDSQMLKKLAFPVPGGI